VVARAVGRRCSPWFRLMGATIGRGVGATYCLPETDLVELATGPPSTGARWQTHLFHDRMLSMDRVIPKRGAPRTQQRHPPCGDTRTARYVGPVSLCEG
jgi:hypothetical protein